MRSNLWVTYHDMSVAHRIIAISDQLRLKTDCGCVIPEKWVVNAHPSVRKCSRCRGRDGSPLRSAA